ncbi:MAG: hypothetical protein ACLQIQ_01115 [Beijerinckiaceae bacterium]
MSALDRFLTLLLNLFGVFMVACFVHILSILLMPQVAPHDGFARLAPLGKTGQLVLLPRPEPEHQVTPFADPAAAQGVCLFDLDKGPLSIRGNIEAGGLITLSFRTRRGRVFYSMTDRATQHGVVDVRVVTAAQRETLEDDEEEEEEEEPQHELRLVSPETIGFVLIRAFVPFPSAWAESEAQINSMTCAQEPLAEE